MNKFLKIFSLLLVLFSSFFIAPNSYALEIEGEVQLKEVTQDSITFTFNPVDGAFAYFAYYDEDSKAEDEKREYSYQISDYIEEPEITVENLEKGKTYFFAISVFDDNLEEGELSKEFSFTTQSTDLKIEEISILNKKQIEVGFNIQLEEASNKEVRIIHTETEEELLIESYEIKKFKNLLLSLDSDLELGADYEITIIALKGINGETIDAGVDGTKNITVPLSTPDYQAEQVIEYIEEVDLNAAAPEEKQEEVVETVETAVEKLDDLPQTGPIHTLLFFLALAIAGVYLRFKK